MFSYIWPMALVVVCNTVYQICAKEISPDINPFASLVFTYIIGAVVSLVLFFTMEKDASLSKEYSQINWATIVLGIVIVGLEVGCIFMYKNGWQISTALVIENIFVALLLILVGKMIYRESITLTKVIGIGFSLIGLFFLSK